MEDIDFEEIPVYEFLKDPAKREKYMEALTDAGIAYVTGDYYVMPDWDSDDHANFDVICRGCGNYDGSVCKIDTIIDTKTLDLPPDNAI